MSEISYDIVVCTKCGQKLRVPITAKGKSFRCVKCSNIVRYQDSNANESLTVIRESGGKITETQLSSFPQHTLPSDVPQIGKWLVENNIITSYELEEALKVQRKDGSSILRTLYQNKKLSSQILYEIVIKKTSIPQIDLKRLLPDRDLLELIPKKICQDRFIFPVSRLLKKLTLAMAIPVDTETQNLISQLTGFSIQPMLAKLDDIEEAIEKYYSGSGPSLSRPQVYVPDSLQTTTKQIEKEETAKIKESKEEPSFTLHSKKPSVVTFPEESIEREKKDVEPLIDRLEYLPFAPTVELALGMVIEEPNTSLDDVILIFADEPSLATALLRWANTSLTGTEKRIGNIWTALALLGISGVQLILQQIKEFQDQKTEFPGLPISGRSKLCAKVAQKLAQNSGKVNPYLAYTTALIHQIGAVVLYMAGPEEYKKIMRESLPEVRLKKELDYFSLNHAFTASLLASKWNFPDIIVQALCHYLEPQKAPFNAKNLAHILYISSLAGLYNEESVADEVFNEAIKSREKSIQVLGLDYREVILSLG
ncbi:MAG: HDOD domain-containing protein [Candidatus Hydrogenedentes bacterium]|nr:HDOD domain-containing protein [Candidatus Hydrogenedentota bacterium]